MRQQTKKKSKKPPSKKEKRNEHELLPLQSSPSASTTNNKSVEQTTQKTSPNKNHHNYGNELNNSLTPISQNYNGTASKSVLIGSDGNEDALPRSSKKPDQATSTSKQSLMLIKAAKKISSDALTEATACNEEDGDENGEPRVPGNLSHDDKNDALPCGSKIFIIATIFMLLNLVISTAQAVILFYDCEICTDCPFWESVVEALISLLFLIIMVYMAYDSAHGSYLKKFMKIYEREKIKKEEKYYIKLLCSYVLIGVMVHLLMNIFENNIYGLNVCLKENKTWSYYIMKYSFFVKFGIEKMSQLLAAWLFGAIVTVLKNAVNASNIPKIKNVFTTVKDFTAKFWFFVLANLGILILKALFVICFEKSIIIIIENFVWMVLFCYPFFRRTRIQAEIATELSKIEINKELESARDNLVAEITNVF